MVDFEEYKNILTQIDKFLKNISIDVQAINKDRKDHIEKVNEEISSYKTKLNIKIFNNLLMYKENISNLNKLIKEKITLSNNYSFDNIKKSSNDLDLLFSNIKNNHTKIIECISKVNSFCNNESLYNIKVEEEKIILNEKEYYAPDFPILTINDFDNNGKLQEYLIELYKNIVIQVKTIDLIIELIDKGEIKNYLENHNIVFKDDIESSINNKFDNDQANYYDSKKKEFENSFQQILQENKKLMNDYQTIETLTIPNYFKDYFVIGHNKFKNYKYNTYKKHLSKVDINNYIKEDYEFNVKVDLKNKGNILIYAENESYCNELIHQLIMQYISCVPYNKMKLALVDIDNSCFDFVYNYSKEYIKNNNLLYTGKVITEEDEFRDLVVSLNKKLIEIKGEKLAYKNCRDIFEYNEISTENPQEMYLLVISNYPKYVDNFIIEKLRNLIKNGNQCGIYTIIVNDYRYDVPENSHKFNSDTNGKFLSLCEEHGTEISCDEDGFMVNDEDFVPNQCFKSKDINDFFMKLELGFDSIKQSQILGFKSILEIDYPKKSYYEQIKIPVGKDAGELIFFDLDVEVTGMSSAIIAGGTGSGKSSFLHTIILSGAYNYSPNELEYYLIDFKDGVEFSPYSDRNNGIYLPHISFLSLKNKVEDAYDILMKIYKEKSRRNEMFKKINVSDIKAYHKHIDVKEGRLPSLSRIVVVIDEYQNFLSTSNTNLSILCNKCEMLLLSLLKDIRSVGISIILSSQSICVEREALDQIYNRYVFSSSPNVLQIAFSECYSDDMNNELNKEKGLVFKTVNGGITKKLFKVSYSGKTNENEQKELAKIINNKWDDDVNRLIISGDENVIPIYKSNIFENPNKLEDEKINVTLGQLVLSNEIAEIVFDDSNDSSYAIIGEVKKSRNYEATIGLSFLNYLKNNEYEITDKELFYLDLNNSNDALRNQSPFDIYQDELKNVMTYSCEIDDIVNTIEYIYDVYLKRKEASKKRKREIQVPILLIVNSFSFINEIDNPEEENIVTESEFDASAELNLLLNGNSNLRNNSSSLADKIRCLYKNGFSYNIYVVVHDKKLNLLNSFEYFVDLSRVICCDENEIENCKVSETSGNIILRELPRSYAVLFPNVSKIKAYSFDKSKEEQLFIKEFVGGLKHE